MIEIAYELVEGRLDAVLQLTDWSHVAGKTAGPWSCAAGQRSQRLHGLGLHIRPVRVRKWRVLVEAAKPIFREKTIVSPSPDRS